MSFDNRVRRRRESCAATSAQLNPLVLVDIRPREAMFPIGISAATA